MTNEIVHTNNTTNLATLESLGDSFLQIYIQHAIDFANGTGAIDGVHFRALTASAGVVVKDKQTRGAMKAIDFQIHRYANSCAPIQIGDEAR